MAVGKLSNLLSLSLPDIAEKSQVLELPSLRRLEVEDWDLTISRNISSLKSFKATGLSKIKSLDALTQLEDLELRWSDQPNWDLISTVGNLVSYPLHTFQRAAYS